jgi:hypothetical protein
MGDKTTKAMSRRGRSTRPPIAKTAASYANLQLLTANDLKARICHRISKASCLARLSLWF